MNIVHIGKYYPPDRGGMESFLQALARKQVQAGHTVHVLAHTEGSKPIKHTEKSLENSTKAGIIIDKGVIVRRCKVAFRIGSYAPIAPALALYSLRHLWAGSDIIHAHSPNIASLYALLVLKRPVILHWHSDVIFPQRPQDNNVSIMPTAPLPTELSKPLPAWVIKGWRVLEKFCLNKAACIIVTSQAYLDSSEFLQPYRHKCRVVPLGLGVAVEANYNSSAVHFLQGDNYFSLLAVGRFSHYKGFDILIKALVSLPRVCLCLVGQGECEASLRLLVQELGLSERVFFAGNLSEGELRACYQSCQCVVLPSILRTEAFGMVLLEAMREGKACIVSDVVGSGMGTVVMHERTGLLYRAGDVLGLVAALEKVSTDRKLCMLMGKAGYERYMSVYNMDNICAMIEDIYKGVR